VYKSLVLDKRLLLQLDTRSIGLFFYILIIPAIAAAFPHYSRGRTAQTDNPSVEAFAF
jgi:hypothetical protein